MSVEISIRGVPDLERVVNLKRFHEDLKEFLSASGPIRQAAIDYARSTADELDDQLLQHSARTLGVSISVLLEHIAVALVIRNSIEDHRLTVDAAIELLGKAVAEDAELTVLVTGNEKVLRDLMTVTNDDKLKQWTQRAVGSFLPRLTDIEATWDIRPVTDDDGRAVDYVPIVIMRITSESDARTKELAVQLDARSLSRLRTVIGLLDENESDIAACCHNLTKVHEEGGS